MQYQKKIKKIRRIFKKAFKTPSFKSVISSIYNFFRFLARKFSFIYTLNLSFVVLIFFVLFYFLVVVNIHPFSSKVLKDTIASSVSKQLNSKVSISDVIASFTYSGKLKVEALGFEMEGYEALNQLKIRKIELELPLYRLLIFNFQPNAIIVSDSKMEIEAKSGSIDGLDIKDNVFRFSGGAIEFFDQVRVKNLDIDIINPKKGNLTINIPDSKFFIDINGDIQIDNESKITIGDNFVNLSSKCVLKKKTFFGNCRFFATNIDLKILSKMQLDKNILDDLHGIGNFGVIAAFNERVEADLTFTSSRILFDSDGVFNSNKEFLNLNLGSSIKIKDSIISFRAKASSVVTLPRSKKDEKATMYFESFSENVKKKISTEIVLKNLKEIDINNFWPKKFFGLKTRKWLEKSILKTNIDFISYSFDFDNLKNIANSKILFNLSSLDLKYSDKFPTIKNANLDGIFDFNSLNISLSSGVIGTSNVTDATATIADIKNPELDIKLSFEGSGPDLFSHINHKNLDLNSHVKTLLNNSSASSKVNIIIPIRPDVPINLRSISIKLSANVEKIYNEYMSGRLSIGIFKSSQMENLSVNVDFNDSFTSKPNLFDIKKNNFDKLTLDFDINNSENFVEINNGLFMLNDKKAIEFSSVRYNRSAEKLDYIDYSSNTKNNSFNLIFNQKDGLNKINLKADVVTMNHDSKSSYNFFKYLSLYNLKSKINIKKFINNDLVAKNLSLNINCKKLHCIDLSSSVINDNELVFNLYQSSKNNYILDILDSGYFSELFNISSSISAKRSIFDFSFVDGLYVGTFKAKDPATIFQNETFKRFESDDMFSKIKDQIFSQNKTIFSRASGNFEFDPSTNRISFDKFVANNFKIGITAKGFLDLNTRNFKISGMIIPAYFINNLFGIGNVPIIGDVVNKLVIGDENSGIFGLKYLYSRSNANDGAKFKTFPITSILPSSIQNLLIN